MKNGFKTLIVAAAATAAAITYIKKLDSENTESKVVKINKDADENQPKGKITAPQTQEIKTVFDEIVDTAQEVITQVKEDAKDFAETIVDNFTEEIEEQEEEEEAIDHFSTMQNIFSAKPTSQEDDDEEEQPMGLASFMYSQFGQADEEPEEEDEDSSFLQEEEEVVEPEEAEEIEETIVETEKEIQQEANEDLVETIEEIEDTKEQSEETLEVEETEQEMVEEVLEVEEPKQEIVEEETEESIDAEEMIENSFAQKEIASQEDEEDEEEEDEEEEDTINEEITEEEPVVEERDSDDAELVEPEHEEDPTFDQPVIEALKVEYDGTIPMIKSMTDAELVEKFTTDYPVLTENKVLSIIKQLKLMYETVDPNAECVRLQHYIAFADEETRETFAFDAADKGFNVEKENNNFNLYISNVIDNNFDDITIMIMQLAAASVDYSGKYKGWALR